MKRKRTKMFRWLHYYGSKWWMRQFLYPEFALVRRTLVLVSALRSKKKYSGFYFHVPDGSAAASDDFIETMVLVLDFISQHDPRRYKTIARHIRVIRWYPNKYNAPWDALYHRVFKICVINDNGFFEERAASGDKRTNLRHIAWFAILFVHEATHGRVHGNHIPYDKKHQVAIEKLCHKEERRFFDQLYRKGILPKTSDRPFYGDAEEKP